MENKCWLQRCRVCGYDNEFLIWGESGNLPSFEICPCCGVQFGYSDETEEDCNFYRTFWAQNEALKWFSPKLRPDNWNWDEQKKLIPRKFK